MKASSIIDNVINLKHDLLKVNKNSDKNFENYMKTENETVNTVDLENNSQHKEISNSKKTEEKNIFKKIENIKTNDIKGEKTEDVLSEKLPKKIEQIINFISSNENLDISSKKLGDLKSLLQNLLSKIKELKNEKDPLTKEKIIEDLKEISNKLKEIFPDKDIKINLINLKDNLVIDINVEEKSLLIQVNDKKINLFKYKQNKETKKTLETNNKISNESKNTKNHSVEQNKIEADTQEIKDKKNLLSLVHQEKIKNTNNLDLVISDKETNNLSKENFNKNSLINLKNLLNDFFEKQKNVQTKDKNNDSKIKLSQMLAGKNDFLKLSKNISYFDLTSRIKIDSKKSQNEKNSDQNAEIKNNENLSLSKDNSPVEKTENIKPKPDDKKLSQNEEVKKSNYIDRVSKNSHTESKETNEVSKNQNIETNIITSNKTNIQTNNPHINRTTFNNPINLRNFNAQIIDIITQKSTENTFREIVTIKVNPPDLGNVDVEIMKSGKTISISILTENENAKNFITRTIQSLIGSLRDQGFNPVNVKVETPPESDFMDTEKQNQQNKQQEQHTEENSEEKEFENILRGEENV